MKKNEKTTKRAGAKAEVYTPKPATNGPYKDVKGFAKLCLNGKKPRGAYVSMNVNTGAVSFVCGSKKEPYAISVDIPVALEKIAKALGVKVVHVS